MELLILAAGRGSRLGSLTNSTPKGLIKINNQSIIERQIEIVKDELSIKNINIAVGYNYQKFEQLKDVKKILISSWDKFNMVGTFLKVIELNQINKTKDLLLTYGDIFLRKGFFDNTEFCNKKNLILPIIDDWKKQWKGRYTNPLSDLETLRYDKNNQLTEIGKKPIGFDEIMGQFTGIIYIPSNRMEDFIISCNQVYSSNVNADMTYLLSWMLSRKITIEISRVPNSKWFEIDTPRDLKYVIQNEKYFKNI